MMPQEHFQNLARSIGDDLALERVTLLLARVETTLCFRIARTRDRRLKAVHNNSVHGVGTPGELTSFPALVRFISGGGTKLTKNGNDFRNRVFGDIRRDAEELSGDGVA